MIFDLIFIIDATGSMGSLINSAKTRMKEIVALVDKENINAKYSLIAYRDHVPNDNSWPSKIFADRVDTADKIISAIKRLRAEGGGDEAESGFDAIRDIENLNWGNDSRSLRLCFFIGDAPIKGTEGSNRFSHGDRTNNDKQCPCGLTLVDIRRTLEKFDVELYGFSLRMGASNSFKQFCKEVDNLDYSKVINKIIEKVKGYKTIQDFAVDELLPVLEEDPRIPNAELTKQFGRDVTFEIEFLNKFGYTEHLLKEVA